MMYQLEFVFETEDEKNNRLKKLQEEQEKLGEIFCHLDSDYVYNKYVDGLLDFLPYSFGWGLRNRWHEFRFWLKCKYQTLKYGVSDDDIFDLETKIAEFILPRLVFFKKRGKNGIPIRFLPNNYDTLNQEEKTFAETKAQKEIDFVLDEMIFAFDYTINPDKYVKFPESIKFFDDNGNCNLNKEKTIEEKMTFHEYMKNSEDCNNRKARGFQIFMENMDILYI